MALSGLEPPPVPSFPTEFSLSWFCGRATLPVCRLSYNVSDITFHDPCYIEPIKLGTFELARPAYLGLGLLNFICAVDLSWSVYSDSYSTSRGRFEYALFFLIYAAWTVVAVLDHCFFDMSAGFGGTMWTFADTTLSCCICVAILLAGFSEQMDPQKFKLFRSKPRKVICVISFAVLGVLQLVGFFAYRKLLEYVWLVCVFAAVTLYPLSQLRLIGWKRLSPMAIALFLISFAAVVAGFVLFIGFGQWLCRNLTPYFGEEFFMCGLLVGIWVFFRFFLRRKEEERKDLKFEPARLQTGETIHVCTSNTDKV